jgi:hypothetical protein
MNGADAGGFGCSHGPRHPALRSLGRRMPWLRRRRSWRGLGGSWPRPLAPSAPAALAATTRPPVPPGGPAGVLEVTIPKPAAAAPTSQKIVVR